MVEVMPDPQLSAPPAPRPTGNPLEELFDGLPSTLRRWLRLVRVDPTARQGSPLPMRWAVALLVANAASLIADAILVVIGEWIFPSTQGFPHFQFSDYGKLTIVGVTIACVAWPVVTWISSQPRWLFLRLAVLVTLVLWLPDVWILLHGEPIQGVGVLMLMHLAIITYPALVILAPVGLRPGPPTRVAIAE
ncbi:MAG TPA: hypothetical protein DEG26_12090 [Chloroflexi bacterium]|jgi:hypothetical protein|nr:hypothetical protein [Chloroflexota bacterium]